MRKTFKLTAILLALTLLMGMLPTAAFAEADETPAQSVSAPAPEKKAEPAPEQKADSATTQSDNSPTPEQKAESAPAQNDSAPVPDKNGDAAPAEVAQEAHASTEVSAMTDDPQTDADDPQTDAGDGAAVSDVIPLDDHCDDGETADDVILEDALQNAGSEDDLQGDTPSCPHEVTRTFTENVVSPTCAASGSHDEVEVCTGCHAEIRRTTIIDAPSHIWGEYDRTVPATCEAPGGLFEDIVCSECGALRETLTLETYPALGHEWGAWTVTTPATCEASGVETRICQHDASHTETRDIEARGHEWGAWSVTTPATCEETGVETRTCQHDASHTETRDIEARGHEWGQWAVTTPATCEETGVETRICQHDKSHTETRAIEALGHEWGQWAVTTPATCEASGVETRVCQHDQSHTENREIEARGHEWGAWAVTTPATLDAAGVETRICAHDEAHVETRAIEPLSAAWGPWEITVPATCEDIGAETRINMRDAQLTETRDIEALGHEWGAWAITTPATCDEPGVETRVCQHDQSHTENRDIEALGHEWGAWTVTTPATCEDIGAETRTCQHDQSHTENRDIEALGHEWGDWVLTTPACLETGEETRTCAHDISHTETRGVDPIGHVPGGASRENEVPATTAREGRYDRVVRCANCDAVLSRETVVIPRRRASADSGSAHTGDTSPTPPESRDSDATGDRVEIPWSPAPDDANPQSSDDGKTGLVFPLTGLRRTTVRSVSSASEDHRWLRNVQSIPGALMVELPDMQAEVEEIGRQAYQMAHPLPQNAGQGSALAWQEGLERAAAEALSQPGTFYVDIGAENRNQRFHVFYIDPATNQVRYASIADISGDGELRIDIANYAGLQLLLVPESDLASADIQPFEARLLDAFLNRNAQDGGESGPAPDDFFGLNSPLGYGDSDSSAFIPSQPSSRPLLTVDSFSGQQTDSRPAPEASDSGDRNDDGDDDGNENIDKKHLRLNREIMEGSGSGLWINGGNVLGGITIGGRYSSTINQISADANRDNGALLQERYTPDDNRSPGLLHIQPFNTELLPGRSIIQSDFVLPGSQSNRPILLVGPVNAELLVNRPSQLDGAVNPELPQLAPITLPAPLPQPAPVIRPTPVDSGKPVFPQGESGNEEAPPDADPDDQDPEPDSSDPQAGDTGAGQDGDDDPGTIPDGTSRIMFNPQLPRAPIRMISFGSLNDRIGGEPLPGPVPEAPDAGNGDGGENDADPDADDGNGGEGGSGSDDTNKDRLSPQFDASNTGAFYPVGSHLSGVLGPIKRAIRISLSAIDPKNRSGRDNGISIDMGHRSIIEDISGNFYGETDYSGQYAYNYGESSPDRRARGS